MVRAPEDASAGPASQALPETPSKALAGLLTRAPESFTDLRRRKLTQVDVLSAAPPLRTLNPWLVALAAAGAFGYAALVLPGISTFGESHWRTAVAAGTAEARPGGPFAEVSFAYAVLLSLIYVSLAFIGVNRMAQRRSPVRVFLFECMVVHNISQCLVNLYCFVMLVVEGHARGLGLWGNPGDATEAGQTLGRLIWLQYHARQLQLLETFFMVLRKKFEGVSFLHLYLRVLNLWGWYIACHAFGGGEAFFPALVSSACQASVYGIYSSFSFFTAGAPRRAACGASGKTFAREEDDTPSSASGTPRARKPRAARVFELQIAQYVVNALHAIGAACFGNFPRSLAFLHLFVITNGLVLYTDFHSRRHDANEDLLRATSPSSKGPRRVTFSFDSSGWLMVYHLGVAAMLSEHMGLEVDPTDPFKEPARPGVAFSGSSGGSLVTCVLATGSRVRDVFEFMLKQYPECHINPLRMFGAVERAILNFQYPRAHERLTGRARVLLTRVRPWPPFVMGEVADTFPDLDTATALLCASCHVPLAAGILPRRVGDGYYYDGLVWPSRLLVPWRAADGDFVVRVSATGSPLSDITMPRVPFWWGLLPPPPAVLRGLFWMGYRDMSLWLAAQPVDKSSFDPCGCRRTASSAPTSASHASGASSALEPGADAGSGATAGQAEGDQPGEEDEGGGARWRAARALLVVPPGALPEKDLGTGEDVQALIDGAEALAVRLTLAAQRAAAAILVGFVAVAVSILTSMV